MGRINWMICRRPVKVSNLILKYYLAKSLTKINIPEDIVVDPLFFMQILPQFYRNNFSGTILFTSLKIMLKSY